MRKYLYNNQIFLFVNLQQIKFFKLTNFVPILKKAYGF